VRYTLESLVPRLVPPNKPSKNSVASWSIVTDLAISLLLVVCESTAFSSENGLVKLDAIEVVPLASLTGGLAIYGGGPGGRLGGGFGFGCPLSVRGEGRGPDPIRTASTGPPVAGLSLSSDSSIISSLLVFNEFKVEALL